MENAKCLPEPEKGGGNAEFTAGLKIYFFWLSTGCFTANCKLNRLLLLPAPCPLLPTGFSGRFQQFLHH